MFKKVLIAEDLDAINKAVESVLQKLGVQNIVHSQYCDEAYLKLKKAALDKAPFDLLICDLSFKKDYREESISSGEELAKKVRQEIPQTKTIIYTVEDQPSIVKRIHDKKLAQAYVCKDRNGLKHLEEAILALEKNQKYLSPDIEKVLKKKNIVQLSDFENILLKGLSQGLSQDEISQLLKEEKISPSSKSSIEKKLKDLRENFGAKTNPHLINILKEYRLI